MHHNLTVVVAAAAAAAHPEKPRLHVTRWESNEDVST